MVTQTLANIGAMRNSALTCSSTCTGLLQHCHSVSAHDVCWPVMDLREGPRVGLAPQPLRPPSPLAGF